MKFCSETTTVLVSLATTAWLLAFSSVNATIVEKSIVKDEDGNWWTTRLCPNSDCAYMERIIEEDTDGGDGGEESSGHRKLKVSSNKLQSMQERRRASEVVGPAFEAPVGNFIDSKGPIDIVISGWDARLDMEYVLKKDDGSNYEIRYPIGGGDSGGPFVVAEEEGIAMAKIKPTGGEGLYRQSIEYTQMEADGSEVAATLEGGSFTYEHRGQVIRRSGPLQVVGEAPYEQGGAVLEAVGRIYFSSMGADYACTGTAIKDNKSGRSLVFTAAHCVWDDIDENFGSDAIFVPNRDAVTGATLLEGNMTLADIHRQCDDDICGCWSLSGGVVHTKWPDTPWPRRLEYDYGFYVVNDVGSHEGAYCGSEALDMAVDALNFEVGVPLEGEFAHSFGYSLEFNPDFRYCAETVTVNQPTAGLDTAWMDTCGLTGGSSGGPWITNFDSATGVGSVVSVNSWSYSASTGNGAPFIEESAARCLINTARAADMEWMMAQPEGEQGIYANCHDRPCIPATDAMRRKLRGATGRQLCEKEH